MEANIQLYQCSKCHRNLINQRNLEFHQKFCGSGYKSRCNICDKCDKNFLTSKALAEHLITCGRFMCYQCNIPFIHPKALNFHIENYHRKSFEQKKQYKCSICNHLCSSRKDLYNHRMIQHGGNDILNFIPPYIIHHENEKLKQTYITNREHILAEDEHGDLKKTYNFPTNNLHRGYREIRGQINQIYNE